MQSLDSSATTVRVKQVWKTAITIQTEETCPSGQDRCLTTTAELKLSNVTFKSFIRSCTTKEVCDNFTTFLQACRSVGGECEVSCCDKDLCNTHFAITLKIDRSDHGHSPNYGSEWMLAPQYGQQHLYSGMCPCRSLHLDGKDEIPQYVQPSNAVFD